MYFHYFEKSLKIKNFAVNRVTFKVKCQGVILQNKEKKNKESSGSLVIKLRNAQFDLSLMKIILFSSLLQKEYFVEK